MRWVHGSRACVDITTGGMARLTRTGCTMETKAMIVRFASARKAGREERSRRGAHMAAQAPTAPTDAATTTVAVLRRSRACQACPARCASTRGAKARAAALW